MSTRIERNPDTITIYGADWCGDCIRAKAFFDDADVAYDYIDIEEHPDETEEILQRNGGVRKIPLVLFPDESFLIEPTNAQLETKMAELETSGVAGTSGGSPDNNTAAVPTDDVGTSGGSPDNNTVIENSAEGRFELHVDGEIISVADYSERDGGVVVIPHVGTDPAHRGKGNAGKLMDGVLDIIRESDRTVMALCPFAAAHVQKNPEYQDLVA